MELDTPKPSSSSSEADSYTMAVVSSSDPQIGKVDHLVHYGGISTQSTTGDLTLSSGNYSVSGGPVRGDGVVGSVVGRIDLPRMEFTQAGMIQHVASAVRSSPIMPNNPPQTRPVPFNPESFSPPNNRFQQLVWRNGPPTDDYHGGVPSLPHAPPAPQPAPLQRLRPQPLNPNRATARTMPSRVPPAPRVIDTQSSHAQSAFNSSSDTHNCRPPSLSNVYGQSGAPQYSCVQRTEAQGFAPQSSYNQGCEPHNFYARPIAPQAVHNGSPETQVLRPGAPVEPQPWNFPSGPETMESKDYVVRQVDVPMVHEQIVYRPVRRCVEVPKVITKCVPKRISRPVEQVVEVPGPIIEVNVPHRIEEYVPKFVPVDKPIQAVIAQKYQPHLEVKGSRDVEAVCYEPDIRVVDVYVPKMVNDCVTAQGHIGTENAMARRVNVEDVPPAQWNTLCLNANPHLSPSELPLIPRYVPGLEKPVIDIMPPGSSPGLLLEVPLPEHPGVDPCPMSVEEFKAAIAPAIVRQSERAPQRGSVGAAPPHESFNARQPSPRTEVRRVSQGQPSASYTVNEPNQGGFAAGYGLEATASTSAPLPGSMACQGHRTSSTIAQETSGPRSTRRNHEASIRRNGQNSVATNAREAEPERTVGRMGMCAVPNPANKCKLVAWMCSLFRRPQPEQPIIIGRSVGSGNLTERALEARRQAHRQQRPMTLWDWTYGTTSADSTFRPIVRVASPNMRIYRTPTRGQS